MKRKYPATDKAISSGRKKRVSHAQAASTTAVAVSDEVNPMFKVLGSNLLLPQILEYVDDALLAVRCVSVKLREATEAAAGSLAIAKGFPVQRLLGYRSVLFFYCDTANINKRAVEDIYALCILKPSREPEGNEDLCDRMEEFKSIVSRPGISGYWLGKLIVDKSREKDWNICEFIYNTKDSKYTGYIYYRSISLMIMSLAIKGNKVAEQAWNFLYTKKLIYFQKTSFEDSWPMNALWQEACENYAFKYMLHLMLTKDFLLLACWQKKIGQDDFADSLYNYPDVNLNHVEELPLVALINCFLGLSVKQQNHNTKIEHIYAIASHGFQMLNSIDYVEYAALDIVSVSMRSLSANLPGILEDMLDTFYERRVVRVNAIPDDVIANIPSEIVVALRNALINAGLEIAPLRGVNKITPRLSR